MANPWYQSIQEAALARCPAILQDWLPGGSLQGTEYKCGSIDGGQGQSLRVSTTKGLWSDFATGDKGNLIGLYCALRHIEYKEAARELAEQFHIERPTLKIAPQVWEPITPIPDWAPMTDEGLPAIPVRQDGTEVRGAWCYLSPDGEPLCWRIRLEKPDGTKDIIPLTFCRNRDSGAAEWRWRDLSAPRPLFGLEMLAALPDASVLVVEGEKTAEAGMRLFPDWVVVTWPGGTGRVSTKHTDWSPLINHAGRKVVWPDADPDGVKAATQLLDVLPDSAVVQPDPTWRKGWDLADGEVEGWTPTQALEYLEAHLVAPKKQPTRTERESCNISSGDLYEQTEQAWTAIRTVNVPIQLLSSADGLILVDRDAFGKARRRPVDTLKLRAWLVDRIIFQRFTIDKETERPIKIPTSPPLKLLENLIASSKPNVPFLRHLTEVPKYTEDGRLLTAEGYDETSCTYHLPPPEFQDMAIGNEISEEEKDGATALVDDLLADFPFTAAVDRAHCIAFLMLPLIRNLIAGPTPMFRFEAPQAGTGKSLLMKMLASINSSRSCTVSQLDTEDEWRKRITSALADDPDTFMIDNARSLESDQLKKLLTDETWEDRKMREHEDTRFAVRATFAVSLNNPVISREIMRRSLRVRMDARLEHPELRPAGGFNHRFINEYARINRRQLVEALLTLTQYAIPRMKDEPGATVLGGYEDFSRKVGGILQALGIEGFLGDRMDLSALNDEDSSFARFVQEWGAWRGERWTLTMNLVLLAEKCEIGFGRAKDIGDDGKIPAGRIANLGKLLKQKRGATVGDWTIFEQRHGREGTEWRLKSCHIRHSDTESTTDTAEEEGETPF